MCGVCVTVIVPVTSTVNPPTDNNIDPDCSGSFKLSGAVRVTGGPGAMDENTPVLPIPATGAPENAVTCVALASGAFNKALTSMILIVPYPQPSPLSCLALPFDSLVMTGSILFRLGRVSPYEWWGVLAGLGEPTPSSRVNTPFMPTLSQPLP